MRAPRLPVQRPKKNPPRTFINYNIIDDDTGYSLWVNPHSVLIDGAHDVRDPSAEFNLILYNPSDFTMITLQSLAHQPPKVLAADFSSYPAELPQIVLVS